MATTIIPIKLRNRERLGPIEVVEASLADNLATLLMSVLLRHREWSMLNDAYKLISRENDWERKRIEAKRGKARERYKKARLQAYALLHEQGVLDPSVEAL